MDRAEINTEAVSSPVTPVSVVSGAAAARATSGRRVGGLCPSQQRGACHVGGLRGVRPIARAPGPRLRDSMRLREARNGLICLRRGKLEANGHGEMRSPV